MSLAAELNKIGGYGYIRFTDLVVGQKYKVFALKSFDSTLTGVARKCLRVDIENGYLILPERYDQKAHTIHSSNVENLYITFNGYQNGKRLDIYFSEEKTT